MTPSYHRGDTGLLLIDPYNDFLSTGGKLALPAQEIATATNTVRNMLEVLGAARQAGIPVFYVPHHRARLTDFAGWKHVSPYQRGAHKLQVFAQDSWGGDWHPDFRPREEDVVVREHWSASGFANTDLDLQLQQHGVEKVVAIGMLANTCVETTAKYAAELGYHVTLVRDATAAFSREAMHAAHEINGPTYAHAILSTQELVAQMAPVPQPA